MRKMARSMVYIVADRPQGDWKEGRNERATRENYTDIIGALISHPGPKSGA